MLHPPIETAFRELLPEHKERLKELLPLHDLVALVMRLPILASVLGFEFEGCCSAFRCLLLRTHPPLTHLEVIFDRRPIQMPHALLHRLLGKVHRVENVEAWRRVRVVYEQHATFTCEHVRSVSC